MSLTLYTPAEAAGVTGLTQLMQRDWRFRGLLPKPERGHARFDVLQLAEMWLLKMFSDQGIGPKVTLSVAPALALRVVEQLTSWDTDVFASDVVLTLDQLDEEFRPTPREMAEVRTLEAQVNLAKHCQHTWMMNFAMRALHIDDLPFAGGPLRVGIRDGEAYLVANEGEPSSFVDGPFLSVHHRSMAVELRNRLPRPPFQFQFRRAGAA